MISIVYSTRKIDESYIKHIEKTCGLKDIEILPYENNGEFSLTEIYNKGLKKSKYDKVVFCHDDIIHNTEKWGKKILKHFNSTDFGIIGMAGTTDMPASGMWWEDRSKMVGIVGHTKDGKTWLSKYSNHFEDKIIQTAILDGLFFAVDKKRIKKNFNEDIKGFHLYDLDFTLNNHLSGVKVGVMFDVRITHKSIGETNAQWEENRKQFVEIYKDNLPHYVKGELFYKKDIRVPKQTPKVSIIIPTKGKTDLLFNCLNSILEISKYPNMEILIADTGSEEDEKVEIKNFINKKSTDKLNIKLVEYYYYNFAAINNDVVLNRVSKDSELILFCNNDITLVNDAISEMVGVYNKNKHNCGTIGARLHYPDNKVQHSGIVLYLGQDKIPHLSHGGIGSYYTYADHIVDNMFGSTAAFLLINKELFIEAGMLNESYDVCFEDVELNIRCLNLRRNNILVGNAVCYHLESQTRGENSISGKDYGKIRQFIFNTPITYNYFMNASYADVLKSFNELMENHNKQQNKNLA